MPVRQEVNLQSTKVTIINNKSTNLIVNNEVTNIQVPQSRSAFEASVRTFTKTTRTTVELLQICLMISSLALPDGTVLFEGKYLSKIAGVMGGIPGLLNQTTNNKDCPDLTASERQKMSLSKITTQQSYSSSIEITQRILHLVIQIKQMFEKYDTMEECDDLCC
ncbi:hypothetical protein CROQUDRAFT_349666 [Cronartium quercuum f. sp. fusiforme G11]|uniref:Uncharacterized protein n=1 Tax=Cronartium quercuum f. sp. fusiforme G11 TaxID=708437 RepID=A0A9P6NL95_9BASI|nr:hypothetical protein CROQUDRAFT_349666 [Cronartium quercuum f. sp. fusiforme G11]